MRSGTGPVGHKHCPTGGHPGGGWLCAVVAFLAVTGAAAHAVAPAIGPALHAVLDVLEVTGIMLAAACGLAGLGWIVHAAMTRREEQVSAARRAPATVKGDASRLIAPRQPAAAGPRVPAARRAPQSTEAPDPWARALSGPGELDGTELRDRTDERP